MKNGKASKELTPVEEYIRKYRPRRFERILGQPTAVKELQELVERKRVPHALLLTGPSGTGKTTAARILKSFLGCEYHDYIEVNAASERGVEMARGIEDKAGMEPMGKARMWHIDEAHQLTKDAQNCLLKVLEDPPRKAYFVLSTTEPHRLLRTVVTRCTEIKFTGVPQPAIKELVCHVAAKEGGSVSEEVQEAIAEAAEGSARKALVILYQIAPLATEEERLEAIRKSDSKVVAFELVKAIMPFEGKPQWSQVRTILEGIKDEDPEGIRRLILAVCATHMTKGGPMGHKAFAVFQAFRDNYFETGKAGLVASCWEVCHG
jgi:DNA polymerase III gamma/tau subunit